jgi:hypothetical protein
MGDYRPGANEADASTPFAKQGWQVGDVAGYAPRFIERQR